MHLLSLSITVYQKQKNSLNFSVFSLKVFSLFINKGGITEIFLELNSVSIMDQYAFAFVEESSRFIWQF